MALLTCPCPFAIPKGAECTGDEATAARKRRPTHSAFSVFCGTQVEFRSCILGINVLRSSNVLFAKLVVDVDSGFLRKKMTRNRSSRARNFSEFAEFSRFRISGPETGRRGIGFRGLR